MNTILKATGVGIAGLSLFGALHVTALKGQISKATQGCTEDLAFLEDARRTLSSKQLGNDPTMRTLLAIEDAKTHAAALENGCFK